MADQTAGFAIWFTGLPASGKTTLARILQQQLTAQAIPTLLLDSDELRTILTPQPTYSEAERDWFYTALAGLAVWLTRNGINVLIAATANRRAYRQAAREQIVRFAEVYVQCSLATCRQRDPKGIYALAQTQPISTIPGLGSHFEPPLAPEVTVNTELQTPADGVESVLQVMRQLGLGAL
jgi:adenylylsulfate kinase